MARYDDDEYVVYRGDEPDAPPVPLRVRLIFVGVVVLIVAVGGLYLFRDQLFPPPPPPKQVTESITSGDRYLRYSLGAEATRLARGGDDIWAVLPSRSEVVKFDTAADRVTVRTRLPQVPADVAVGQGGVWISGQTSVFQVDPESGEVLDEVRSGNAPGDITLQGNAVWVINTGDDTVSHIDASLARVINRIPIAPAAFDIAATKTSIWVAHGAVADGIDATPLITQIDPQRDRVIGEINTAADLRGISVTDSSLWTIHGRERGLGRYSIKTRRQIGGALLDLPGPPGLLYEANKQLYIAIEGKPAQIVVADRVSGAIRTEKPVDERVISDLVANEAGVWLVRRGTRELVRWQTCTTAVPCRVTTLKAP